MLKKEIHCWLLGHEYEFEAHDTDVPIYAMAADVILDDLVVQQPVINSVSTVAQIACIFVIPIIHCYEKMKKKMND